MRIISWKTYLGLSSLLLGTWTLCQAASVIAPINGCAPGQSIGPAIGVKCSYTFSGGTGSNKINGITYKGHGIWTSNCYQIDQCNYNLPGTDVGNVTCTSLGKIESTPPNQYCNPTGTYTYQTPSQTITVNTASTNRSDAIAALTTECNKTMDNDYGTPTGVACKGINPTIRTIYTCCS